MYILDLFGPQCPANVDRPRYIQGVLLGGVTVRQWID